MAVRKIMERIVKNKKKLITIFSLSTILITALVAGVSIHAYTQKNAKKASVLNKVEQKNKVVVKIESKQAKILIKKNTFLLNLEKVKKENKSDVTAKLIKKEVSSLDLEKIEKYSIKATKPIKANFDKYEAKIDKVKAKKIAAIKKIEKVQNKKIKILENQKKFYTEKTIDLKTVLKRAKEDRKKLEQESSKRLTALIVQDLGDEKTRSTKKFIVIGIKLLTDKKIRPFERGLASLANYFKHLQNALSEKTKQLAQKEAKIANFQQKLSILKTDYKTEINKTREKRIAAINKAKEDQNKKIKILENQKKFYTEKTIDLKAAIKYENKVKKEIEQAKGLLLLVVQEVIEPEVKLIKKFTTLGAKKWVERRMNYTSKVLSSWVDGIKNIRNKILEKNKQLAQKETEIAKLQQQHSRQLKKSIVLQNKQT